MNVSFKKTCTLHVVIHVHVWQHHSEKRYFGQCEEQMYISQFRSPWSTGKVTMHMLHNAVIFQNDIHDR